MDNFRTVLKPKKSENQIKLNDKVMTIGSCFSDVIGNYLSEHKFDVLANPFGTVYNPISIFSYFNKFNFNNEHYTELNQSHFHFDAHSNFFGSDKALLSTKLNQKYSEFSIALKTTDYLILTLGSSFVYTFNKTGKIVANCHKVPQSDFNKRLLSLDEMWSSFDSAFKSIKKINSDVKLLLTVSPVRHIKDGMEENNISKALLRVFCNDVCSKYDSVDYFPSYELMMDDLRDYRFYKPDMIHPNEVAETYIWNFFQETYFSDQTKRFIQDWQKILNAKKHNAFNPSSEAHQNFIKSTIEKLKLFSSLIDVKEETKHFESLLK